MIFISGLGSYSKPYLLRTTTIPVNADGTFNTIYTTGGIDSEGNNFRCTRCA